eukprot:1679597-Rhodomonas_salina.1
MVTPIFFVAYLLTRPPVMVAGIPIENAYEIGVTGSNGGSLSLAVQAEMEAAAQNGGIAPKKHVNPKNHFRRLPRCGSEPAII